MRVFAIIAAGLAALGAAPAAAQEGAGAPLPSADFTVVGGPVASDSGEVYYVYLDGAYYACAAATEPYSDDCVPIEHPYPIPILAFEAARGAWIDAFSSNGCYFSGSYEAFEAAEARLAPLGVNVDILNPAIVSLVADGALEIDGDAARLVVGCEAPAETGDVAEIRAAIIAFFEARDCAFVQTSMSDEELEAHFAGLGFDPRQVERVADQMFEAGEIVEDEGRAVLIVGCGVGAPTDRDAIVEAAIVDFFVENGCAVTITPEFDAQLEAYFTERGVAEDEVRRVGDDMIRAGRILEDGDRLTLAGACVAAAEPVDVTSDPGGLTAREAETRAAIIEFFGLFDCVVPSGPGAGAKIEAWFTARGFSESEIRPMAERMLAAGELVETNENMTLAASVCER